MTFLTDPNPRTGKRLVFWPLVIGIAFSVTACTRSPNPSTVQTQSAIVKGIADDDAVPPQSGGTTDLLFEGPLTPRVSNQTVSSRSQSGARLPALSGIRPVGIEAGSFPYLNAMSAAFTLQVVAQEMADSLTPAPGKTSAEFFAIGPRMWSQAGQLYRATVRSNINEKPEAAMAEVERLWQAAGATLITSSIKHDNLIRLPIAYWPHVCAEQMSDGPSCSSLRTYAMQVGGGQVWLQVGLHKPTHVTWVSVMGFGQDIPQATANAIPAPEINESSAGLIKPQKTLTAPAPAAGLAPTPEVSPYTKQACMTIPVSAAGIPDISLVPIRTTLVGVFPFITDMPDYKLSDPVRRIVDTPNEQKVNNRDAYFIIGTDIHFLSGKFGIYQYENLGSSFAESKFEKFRESGLIELGAVCVTNQITPQGIARANKLRGLELSKASYESQLTYVLRLPKGAIWFRTASTDTTTIVLLQGELAYEQSAARGRKFYVAPPPPPPPPPPLARPKTPREAINERPIPPFDINANFTKFNGTFVLELPKGEKPQGNTKMIVASGLVRFEGPGGYAAPAIILGNRITVVGPHADAEIRIVDQNTLVWLPPAGTTGADWMKRE